jgi:NTE family protein
MTPPVSLVPERHKLGGEMSSAKPRIGLALSSGAARGLAHIGVIQVLEENGIAIDAIAGSSMGAYVGALWAAGHTGEDLEEFAAEITGPRELWRRLDFAIPPVRGLIRGQGVRRHLATGLQNATFAGLKRRLFVVAADLDTLQRRVFCEGDVSEAVHASASVPGLCVPVEIDGHRYGDGGVVDPLPVDVLRAGGCDKVIAVNVLPSVSDVARGLTARSPRRGRSWLSRLNRSVNVFAPGNVVELLRRSVFSAQIRLAEHSERLADVNIHANSSAARWHDYHRHADYIALGRRATEVLLPAILALQASAPPAILHETVTLPATTRRCA